MLILPVFHALVDMLLDVHEPMRWVGVGTGDKDWNREEFIVLSSVTRIRWAIVGLIFTFFVFNNFSAIIIQRWNKNEFLNDWPRRLHSFLLRCRTVTPICWAIYLSPNCRWCWRVTRRSAAITVEVISVKRNGLYDLKYHQFLINQFLIYQNIHHSIRLSPQSIESPAAVSGHIVSVLEDWDFNFGDDFVFFLIRIESQEPTVAG